MAKKSFIGMELIGADELKGAFVGVRQGLVNRVLKRAVTKAAHILVAPLRRVTPVAGYANRGIHSLASMKFPPGTTRKAVGTAYRRYKGGQVQAVYVGHRFPQGAAAGWRERGTKSRMVKGPYAHSTGAVSPDPFFGPVYEQNKGVMHDRLRSEIAVGIEDEARKAGIRSLRKAGIDLRGL